MDAVSSLPRLGDPIDLILQFPRPSFIPGDAILAAF